jgi:hypothetical protein
MRGQCPASTSTTGNAVPVQRDHRRTCLKLPLRRIVESGISPPPGAGSTFKSAPAQNAVMAPSTPSPDRSACGQQIASGAQHVRRGPMQRIRPVRHDRRNVPVLRNRVSTHGYPSAFRWCARRKKGGVTSPPFLRMTSTSVPVGGSSEGVHRSSRPRFIHRQRQRYRDWQTLDAGLCYQLRRAAAATIPIQAPFRASRGGACLDEAPLEAQLPTRTTPGTHPPGPQPMVARQYGVSLVHPSHLRIPTLCLKSQPVSAHPRVFTWRSPQPLGGLDHDSSHHAKPRAAVVLPPSPRFR